jgi:glycosyltransferase involved in cell wall biosynthesis
MNLKPRVSIILPVYNSEKYLHKCINSILAQTFSDFELIIVNDGSQDQSVNICNEFLEKDKRIRVFHKANEGVSSARNVGIDNAVGKYVCFIDSDDWVEEEYIESFFVEELECDESVFVIQDILKETKVKTYKYCNFPRKILQTNEFSGLFTKYEIYRYGHPFSKLYYLLFIREHSIRFDSIINYSEDLVFMLEYMKHVKKILLLKSAKYHYVDNGPNTLINTFNSFDSEFYGFKKISSIVESLIFCLELDAESTRKLHYKVAHYYSRSVQSIYKSKNADAQKSNVPIFKRLIIDDNVKNMANKKDFRSQRTVKFTLFFLEKGLYKTLDIVLNLLFTVKWKLERFQAKA